MRRQFRHVVFSFFLLAASGCSDFGGPAHLTATLAAEPCQTDQDCADDDKCTVDTCEFNPSSGGLECLHVFQPQCVEFLPYKAAFDGKKHACGSWDDLGWKVMDYGNDATKNWCVASSGTLGPDEHIRFHWSPTQSLVTSVAATPPIWASGADTSGTNPMQATTLQWRMAYRHFSPGEPVTLTVVATDDGDFANGNVIWQQTVTNDFEYGLYSSQLDNSLKFAPNLQIGFMVDTGAATTFNMDAWEIDDVLVAEGVPNQLAKTRLYKCQTNSCNLADQAVLVSETEAAVPDLTMTVSEHYRYVLCYQDLDFSSSSAPYWGWPSAFLDGPPMDQPGFVTPVDMTGFGGSCYAVAAAVDAMCGVGVASYFCTIDVDPGGLETNLGRQRIGVVCQDEWKPIATGNQHSPLQSLNKATLNVLPDSGYLVWSPIGVEQSAALALKQAIEAAGRPAYVVAALTSVPDLSLYDGVFATLGVKGYAYEPSAQEALALKQYLDGGGRLYIEGGDYWFKGPAEDLDAVLYPYFGVEGLWGGVHSLGGVLAGAGFLDGTGFDYDSGPYCDFYNEGMTPTPQSGAVVFMLHEGGPDFAVVTANQSAGWRVIGSSVLFGCLKEKDLGSTDYLMNRYLYFLENGLPGG
ncbi:MAG: hypothetical protein GXP54_02705 [Deltaproteobacteria bacterium]|nr:hypothetical protein [Deltaproteobacteria bacterium]